MQRTVIEMPAQSMTNDRTRTALRWILALFYATAGIVHLRSPGGFLPIVPDWVPFPREVVLGTGVAEIAGAIGLLTSRFRVAAGWALAAYAVAVFPANIKHAVYGVEVAGMTLGWWYHGPRLALQPVLVWWALWCSGAVGSPKRA